MSAGYALITGASSGIGAALAEEFARHGKSLILAARSKDTLDDMQKQLSEQHNVEVIVHAVDLSVTGAAEKLYAWVDKQKLTVDCLVNNAAFGDRVDVIEADLERQQAMIQLNIETVATLSKLFGADMAQRGQGNIVNIASIAGFIPGPGMAVYYATKAFVLSFSQALNHELQPRGVVVTAICPGPTRSGFAAAAHADDASMFQGNLPTSEQVARFAYRAMLKGKIVAIYSLKYRIIMPLLMVAPRRWLLSVVRRTQ